MAIEALARGLGLEPTAKQYTDLEMKVALQSKRAYVILVMLAAALGLAYRFSPPSEIGTPIQRVEEDVHDEVKAQMATRMEKGISVQKGLRKRSRNNVRSGDGLSVRQKRTFLTRWKTYTNDESGMIISVDVDWVWHGLP